jgi:hypothetical protein
LKKLIRHHLQRHRELDSRDAGVAEQRQRTAQTIATLSAAADKIGEFLKKSEPRMGKAKKPKEVKSNITDNDSAKMTTSKGTIQGYNGIAAVDSKHQIVIAATALGEGQEQHSLQPVLIDIKDRFKRLKISKNLYKTGIVVTADTGFAHEANMEYLKLNRINAYIPDNQFRSRDPKFADHKGKYAKKPAVTGKPWNAAERTGVIPASEFIFDARALTCFCPEGNMLSYRGTKENRDGDEVAYFEGRLLQCRHCPLKTKCMVNPKSADHGKGKGRQVSFVVKQRKTSTTPYTDWMKARIDSEEGKAIYSQRMSVVEPVFGNLTCNKRLRRFSLRGQKKVQGQWQLFCLVQNIEKLQNFGSLAC